MIHVERLQIGDIVGTTSLSPLACAIKLKTWGWRKMFNQGLCNHIATVVSEHSLNYFMEMLGKGIHETDINEYDHSAPRDHICFVGRHHAFDDCVTRERYNDYILQLHAKHIKYGYEDIANFIFEDVGIRLKDKQETLICSELPRSGFKKFGISYPSNWDKDCAPSDWQQWVELQNITKSIVS
jgi:hypothetical protein